MQKTDIEKYKIYADKALAIYGLTYQKVMEKCIDGELEIEIDKKKKKIKWYDYYKMTKEEYERWKEYIMGDLQKKNPQLLEDSILNIFYTIDMVYGLRQDYLFVQVQSLPQLEECNQEHHNLPHNSVY